MLGLQKKIRKTGLHARIMSAPLTRQSQNVPAGIFRAVPFATSVDHPDHDLDVLTTERSGQECFVRNAGPDRTYSFKVLKMREGLENMGSAKIVNWN
jgi:hypothetical protein